MFNVNFYSFFFISILTLIFGLYFKSKRWGLFISVYESPNNNLLLNSLAVGHFCNILLPFRVGDFARIYLSGKKLKNGFSFSFATVIVDLYVDLLTVCLLFNIIYFINFKSIDNKYLIVFLIFILVSILLILFRAIFKKFIKNLASLFNKQIEFKILFVSFLIIASFKDIINKLNLYSFIIQTLLIWVSYLISYFFFSYALNSIGISFTLLEIFSSVFGGFFFTKTSLSSNPLFLLYLIIPLCICFLFSKYRKSLLKDEFSRMVLPQLGIEDRLLFLKAYYLEYSRDNIKYFLEINKDVIILSHNSSGSNATTIKIINDGEFYFRKYALSTDAKKLEDQINWLLKHKNILSLPELSNIRIDNNFVLYDMIYNTNTIDFTKFIHISNLEKSWNILYKILTDLRINLHNKYIRKSNPSSLNNYINIKVFKNLDFIKTNSICINELEKYNTLQVNGECLPTLKFYNDLLSREYLQEIFSNDIYTDIHGDLTIENIICYYISESETTRKSSNNDFKNEYYLIDPNGDNIHDSPLLDYSKILQSLHGNYELLTLIENIDINKNIIHFYMPSTEKYNNLYLKYVDYLKQNFTNQEIISIYFHEIVHWLRLLPYKIKKNDKKSVIFYIGLLSILKDIKLLIDEK